MKPIHTTYLGHMYLLGYMKCCLQELDSSVSMIDNHLCSKERKSLGMLGKFEWCNCQEIRGKNLTNV